ncbi:VTT domain-containing protein [Microgenomates group bacterium]|nr:VTT domain-containing protein [Microgenomates group bacterium]
MVAIFLTGPGWLIKDWYTNFQINQSWEFILLLIITKALSIVYPPLPGIILTIAMIPILGWYKAYLVELLGSLLGVTAAYWLGYKYGIKIIRWIAGEKLLNKIQSIKLKPGNQIEAAFVLRTASGGMLSDALAWGASLIGLHYWPYLLGHLVNHLLVTLPIFLLLGFSIKLHSWLIAVPIMVLSWFLIWKFKGRYFE